MINSAFKQLTSFENASQIDETDNMSNINALEERQYYLSSTFEVDPATTLTEDTTLTDNCLSLR
jgi:hypothetical protein